MNDATAKTIATKQLPPMLQKICDEARAFQEQRMKHNETAETWNRHVASAQEIADGVCVEDNGETVHLGALSPGCRACKEGRWDCMFVAMHCDLNCAFCLKPRAMNLPPMYSAMGCDPAERAARYTEAGITGVSFSGGEPFLTPEPILEQLTQLRRTFPEMYVWAYTHGLSLSVPLLDRLAAAGLDELRFNMAASGYVHPKALDMAREAARRLPAVAVEIPAIPEDLPRLLEALPAWVEAGVKYLNLHELIYEEGSNSGDMPGLRAPCVMPDGHACKVNPRSVETIRVIMQHVAREGLAIGVNECSLRSKARQVRARRRTLAALSLGPHERLLPDGTVECACLFTDTEVEFVHPTRLDPSCPVPEGWSAALLRRLPVLRVGSDGPWVGFELVPS